MWVMQCGEAGLAVLVGALLVVALNSDAFGRKRRLALVVATAFTMLLTLLLLTEPMSLIVLQ
jgi:hypothetical protein